MFTRTLYVDTTGTVFLPGQHITLRGVNLVDGDTATLYHGDAATAANTIVKVDSASGTKCASACLPSIAADKGVHVVLTGASAAAVIYYE
jgi:hypothetical protein